MSAGNSIYEVEDFLYDESFINWVVNDSEKDKTFWEAWMAIHPHSLPAITTARKTLLAIHIKKTRELSSNEIDDMIANLEMRTQPADQKAPYKEGVGKLIPSINYQSPVFKIAAIFIVCLSIGFLFFKQYKASPRIDKGKIANRIQQQINNTKGAMLVRLKDGSSVILKPNAQLSYSSGFNGNNREVYLNGEAFFEVHKDPAHPFLVHSGNWVTRVLGTSFTIQACNKTNKFKVIVNTGKVLVYKETKENTKDVAVKRKAAQYKPVALLPNQEVQYNTANESLDKQNLAKPLMLSKDISGSLFTFRETPLHDVIKNIEKAYDVKIIYNEKEIGGCPLTAALADEHLLEKLDLICKALNVRYYISDGQIVMRGTGCN